MSLLDLFKKRKKLDEIYSFDAEDEEMNLAIDTAKVTLLISPIVMQIDKDFERTGIKVSFETSTGHEHIWCENVKYNERDNCFVGQVANEPENIKDLSKEDWIRVTENEITDWYVGTSSGIVGGYTLKVLRDRLSEIEKREFDERFPYIERQDRLNKTKRKKVSNNK